MPLPFDPIDEAARQWGKRWGGVPAMHAVTSLMRVQQLLIGRLDAILKPHGLTFARYEALVLLTFSSRGSLPLGKMGERLQVHPTSVTSIVRRLETAGLVEGPEAEVRTDQRRGRVLDQPATLGGDLGEHGPAVLRMLASYDEPGGLEPVDDRGDGGRVHLEPLTHLPQRQRPPRGEGQQHQRLVAREGEPERLQQPVEATEEQLLHAHQRGDRVHLGYAVPVRRPLPGRLVDRVERQGRSSSRSIGGSHAAQPNQTPGPVEREQNRAVVSEEPIGVHEECRAQE